MRKNEDYIKLVYYVVGLLAGMTFFIMGMIFLALIYYIEYGWLPL